MRYSRVLRRVAGVAVVAVAATALTGYAVATSGSDGSKSTHATVKARPKPGTGIAPLALTIPYVSGGVTSGFGLDLQFFQQRVAALSGGKITVTLQGGYLTTEVGLLTNVRSHSTQSITVNSANSANNYVAAGISTGVWDQQGLSCFMAIQAPGLISSPPLETKVFVGPIGQSMLDCAHTQAKNVRALGFIDAGLRHPYVVAARQPASLTGLTMRTSTSLVAEEGMFGMGAIPYPVPVGGVASLMKSGAIQGLDATPSVIAGFKLYGGVGNGGVGVGFGNVPTGQTGYFMNNEVMWPYAGAITFNQRFLSHLSAAARHVLATAARDTTAYGIGAAAAQGLNQSQDIANCGVEFVNASPDSLASFNAGAQQAVTTLSLNPTTRSYIRQVQKVVAKTPVASPESYPTGANGTCALP